MRERRKRMTEDMYNMVKEKNRRGEKERRNRQSSQERICENLKKKISMKNIRQKKNAIEKLLEKNQKKERMRKLRMKRKCHKYEEGNELKESVKDKESTKVEESTNDEKSAEAKKSTEFEESTEVEENTEVEINEEDKESDILNSLNPISKIDKEIDSSIINNKKMDEVTDKHKERTGKQKISDTAKKNRINDFPPRGRELSLYEKIREDIISQRNKEWMIYEKEWEKNGMKKYKI